MNRLALIDTSNANDEQAALLQAIESQLGRVPNFLRVFANSPVALRAFLGLHQVAADGLLDAHTRERIALALAQQSGCEYCVAAHTEIGRSTGLSTAEIEAARAGTSHDPKAAAAVKLARSLADKKGEVTLAELLEARHAGFSDAELVEIITHVGLNLLTNILGKASRVEVDFPQFSLQLAA